MAKYFIDFVNAYNGHAIDDDGAYGVQCVDGFRVYCKWLGIAAYPTPNGWADGYWYSRGEHVGDFTPIMGSNNFQNGDVVIWAKKSKSHPSSHIAMYYNGMEFGQRQNESNRAFCSKVTDMSDALGALRPKALTQGGASSSYIYNHVDMSPVFDLNYYLNKYPDVKAEYGNNAFTHFTEYGMKEHRQASSAFNVDIYKANYEDLRKAFGDNMPSYYSHYCTNGKAEGRNATSDINAPKPAPTPSYAPSKSKGTAVAIFDKINVRTVASLKSGLTGSQYNKGGVLNYDSVVTAEGYYWMSYISNSGARHYVAYGTTDGSKKFWNIK